MQTLTFICKTAVNGVCASAIVCCNLPVVKSNKQI